jgi:glycosyltransferase involved in cell wall biosynthesis
MIEITVFTPVYNGEKFIENAILSVAQQENMTSFEHIVVDDGSTDDTAGIVKDYVQAERELRKIDKNNVKARKDDPEVRNIIRALHTRLFRQKHKGSAIAANVALEKARGKYAAFLAADDYWTPKKSIIGKIFLDGAEEWLRQGKLDEKVVGVYTDSWINEVDGKLKQSGDFDKDRLKDEDFINFSSFMFSMDAAREMKERDGFFFDPDAEPTADWDFLIRLSDFGDFMRIPSPMVVYRVHEAQVSSKVVDMMLSRIRVLGRYNQNPFRMTMRYMIKAARNSKLAREVKKRRRKKR